MDINEESKKGLPTYHEWMQINRYWAGRDPANHAHYHKMYGVFVKTAIRKSHNE